MIFSKSPAMDWAKGQLVILTFSVLLLLWGCTAAVQLVLSAHDQGPGDPGLVGEDLGIESGVNIRHGAGAGGREQLRNDLFKVPAPKKKVERKTPKTNPAELLARIELQGVMGGSRPRAIVMYKHNRETITVSAGEDLGEFKVMEIRERSVVLKWREELFELSL